MDYEQERYVRSEEKATRWMKHFLEMRDRNDRAKMAVQIFYDLANKLLNAARFTPEGDWRVPDDVRNDLADFVADFHDDNPGLWGLLTDEQRGEAIPDLDMKSLRRTRWYHNLTDEQRVYFDRLINGPDGDAS